MGEGLGERVGEGDGPRVGGLGRERVGDGSRGEVKGRWRKAAEWEGNLKRRMN